jgi:glycerol-3-phosphate acyltransferase PlsX
LMATARFVLKMITGIDRPAICSALPAMQGHTFMMDLGANVDCTSEHLYQFALMGSVLVKAIDGIESPRIGLLNIGSEEIKGNDVVKQASLLLAGSGLNYIGYVEGNDIFNNKADVVVADGFVGNVSLKSAEGLAHMVAAYLRSEFQRNPLTRLAGLIALPVLKSFRRRIDPRRYNGATLLGLQGIVIKSHGGADKLAFANAIKIAMLEVEHNVISVIDRQINAMEPGQLQKVST